jgi:hypothetical protein
MNDPKKIAILKEVLIEEGIDDDIVDAILSLPKDDPSSEEKKRKVLNYLAGGGDEKDKEIEKLRQQVGGSKEKKQAIIQKLESKAIPLKVSRFIVFEANEEEQLEDLNQLIDSLSENDLKKGNSLKEKVGNLSWINDIVSGQSSLGTGKGEILLALMLDGGKLSDQAYGDVQLGDENIEVKQSSRSSKGVFQGAIISELGRSNDYKVLWNSPILDGGQDGNKQSFRKKYGFEKLLSTWTPIFKRYNDKDINKDEYIEDLKKVMKTGDFDNVDEITKKDFEGENPQNFYKKIAYCSVGEYLSGKSLLLMNSNLDYVYLDEDGYKNAILNDPNIYANNAFSPRISYIEPAEDEPEKIAKPKISAPEKAQQTAKEQDKKREEIIAKEKKAQELKQKLDQADKELKNWKERNPNKNPKPDNVALKNFQQAEKDYKDYILNRKNALSKIGLEEELTNYLIKSFK